MDSKEIVSQAMMKLGSDNNAVVLQAIGELKRTPKSAVPALIEAVKENGSLRYMAAVVLGELGPDAAEAIPVLADLLLADEEETQMVGAFSLYRIGSESLPALLHIANHAEGKSRFWASWAIAMIDPSKIERKMVDVLNREREQPSSPYTPLAVEEALGKIIAYQLKNK